MQKKKNIPVISFAIVIAVLCLLFVFSSQNGETSGALSGSITEFILSIYYNAVDKEIPAKVLSFAHHLVRKGAHFSIYTVLGLGLFGIVRAYCSKKSLIPVITVLSGAIVAASDEFHQRFSAGRSGNLKDVCLDTCGVLFGYLICRAFWAIKARKK